MTQQPPSGAVVPGEEGRSARRLLVPIVFAVVLIAVVMGIVFAIVQPWEDDEVFQRGAPLTPTATATP
jgi:hypothetical protein